MEITVRRHAVVHGLALFRGVDVAGGLIGTTLGRPLLPT
jgi:hypothetical protein